MKYDIYDIQDENENCSVRWKYMETAGGCAAF